jgi:hypothetical protein
MISLFILFSFTMFFIDCNSMPNSNTQQSGKQTFQFNTTLTVEGALYNTVQNQPICDYIVTHTCTKGSLSACEYEAIAYILDTFNLTNATSCLLSYVTTRSIPNGGICYVEASTDMTNWFSVSSLSDSKATATLEDADLSSVCGEKHVLLRFRTPNNCGSVGDVTADWPVISWKVWNIKVVVEH